MIRLKIDTDKAKYSISYSMDESFEVLYLTVIPIYPVKKIVNGTIVLEEKNISDVVKIPIYRSLKPMEVDFPAELMVVSSTYCFCLYDKNEAEGEPLEMQVHYVGPKEIIYWTWRREEKGFGRIIIWCKYRVPHDLFWITFSEIKSNVRFMMPEMEKNEGRYETSCLIKDGASNRLKMMLDERLSDYLIIEKITKDRRM